MKAIFCFVFSPLAAQDYDLESYIDYYEDELEVRLKVLRVIWESDGERIKGEEGGGEWEEVERRYEEWERESEERVREAKAEYMAREGEIEEGERLRQELVELFVERCYPSHELTQGRQLN